MAREFAKKFYRSTLWRSTREFILKRDNYLCQECGEPAQEVHHKIWLTASNINNPEITLNPNNLISLCRNCHFKIHELSRQEAKEKIEIGEEYIFDKNGFLIQCPLSKKSGEP